MGKGREGSGEVREGRGERGGRADKGSLIPVYAVIAKAAFCKYFDVVILCISAHYILIAVFLTPSFTFLKIL